MSEPANLRVQPSAGASRSPAASGGSGVPDARGFAVEAARLLDDEKCHDVVVIDVRGMSQVTDYLVIGSGTSERQMRSVQLHVEDLGQRLGFPAFRSHSDAHSNWLLADCVDVVVHLFEANARAFYDLEMLWGDGARVEWARPEVSAPARRRGVAQAEKSE